MCTITNRIGYSPQSNRCGTSASTSDLVQGRMISVRPQRQLLQRPLQLKHEQQQQELFEVDGMEINTKMMRGETRSTFALSNGSHDVDNSDCSSSDSNECNSPSSTTSTISPTREQHAGFRKDYTLGETLRSPSHMMHEPCPARALRMVDALKSHDFVFVKRSDGSYSYAILAYRTDDKLSFVMSDACITKHISRRHWGEFVRLVSMEGDEECSLPTTNTSAASWAAARGNPTTDRRRISSATELSPSPLGQQDKELAAGEYVRKLLKKDWIPSTISFVPFEEEKKEQEQKQAEPLLFCCNDDDSIVSDIHMPEFPGEY